MNISLSEPEARLLQELLQGDLRRLLLEIAHTDCRSMKDGLKAHETLLQGIIQKLETKDRASWLVIMAAPASEPTGWEAR